MIILERTYIGDDVYVRMDEGKIILTTEIGAESPMITNQVVLEHEIFHNLLAVLKAARERADREILRKAEQGKE